MHPPPSINAVRRCLALAMLVTPFMGCPVDADSYQNTSNCMKGSADGSDYAEYDEDFSTGDWKNHSGVKITSASRPIVLIVTDSYGNSICSNTANPTTQCNFQAGFQSTFTIRLDNTKNTNDTRYEVCAF